MIERVITSYVNFTLVLMLGLCLELDWNPSCEEPRSTSTLSIVRLIFLLARDHRYVSKKVKMHALLSDRLS